METNVALALDQITASRCKGIKSAAWACAEYAAELAGVIVYGNGQDWPDLERLEKDIRANCADTVIVTRHAGGGGVVSPDAASVADSEGDEMVNRIERGWAGHYICAKDCMFRRNTLLTNGDTRVVVSTVGAMMRDHRLEEIAPDRYYETVAFFAKWDGTYWDADVSREVRFDSMRSIGEDGNDNDANDMHEHVVEEIAGRMERGSTPLVGRLSPERK